MADADKKPFTIADKLVEDFDKNSESPSEKTISGVHRIFEAIFVALEKSIGDIRKRRCTCPVCMQSITAIEHSAAATRNIKNDLPTSISDPVEASYLLGIASAFSIALPLQVEQADSLIEAAHAAYGVILTNRLEVYKVGNSEECSQCGACQGNEDSENPSRKPN